MVGCERPEPEPQPDPCLGVEKFEADFSILEGVGDSLVNTDNVLLYSGVVFEPHGDYLFIVIERKYMVRAVH